MILSLLLATMAQAAPTTPPAPPPAGRMMGLRSADTDGDGIVTRAEAMAQADAMFARMDTNKDGTVSAEERQTAMPGRGPQRGGDGELTAARMREMAGRRFDRLDTNGDGRLDAAELAAARPDGRRGGRRGGGDGTPPPGER
jgi:hypothetical protein